MALAPSLTAAERMPLFQSDIVVLIVGAAPSVEQRFELPSKLACYYSEYLNRLITQGVLGGPPQTTIILKTLSPNTVGILVDMILVGENSLWPLEKDFPTQFSEEDINAGLDVIGKEESPPTPVETVFAVCKTADFLMFNTDLVDKLASKRLEELLSAPSINLKSVRPQDVAAVWDGKAVYMEETMDVVARWSAKDYLLWSKNTFDFTRGGYRTREDPYPLEELMDKKPELRQAWTDIPITS